jgi:ElaB/YqjD/DUF883 family membrane-anchored ribosome-binding protein
MTMGSVADQTVVRLKDFRAADVGDKVSTTVSNVAGRIADRVHNWASTARGAAQTTDGFVRSSPWQVVGAVALAGLAAGYLVTRGARAARRRASAATNDSSSEMTGG